MKRSKATIVREYGPFPGIDKVNGVTYTHVFPAGGVTLTAAPFVAPPVRGDSFRFTSTFQAQGVLAGFADANLSQPLFEVPFTGGGSVVVSGRAFTGDPNYVGQAISFIFAAPAATPEPASLILVGSGALLVWRRVSARRRRPQP